MRSFAASLALSLALVACGGTAGPSASVGDDAGGVSPSADGGGGPGTDGGAGNDAASEAGGGADASLPSDPSDGTPTRQACTGSFGNALTATHGRLDGTLVSIVPPGSGSRCNGDSSHLHLQILMSGSVYDVAVNLDTLYLEQDIAMPAGGAWSEGWHSSDSLDYPSVPVHSSAFTKPASPSALASMLESALANANHLAVFATGYGPTGAHDVHRRYGGNDGAIVIDPLSPKSHVYFFCFPTDSF